MYAFQGTTPQAALEEIATTTKPEVLARHLPEPIQKSIEVLPKLKKQEFMDKLLSLKAEQLNSCTVRPAHDSDGWEIIGEDGESQGKVKLDNAFISGLEAMLPLRIESGTNSQIFIVTMHLDGDEWRIDDLGPWAKTDLGLAKLLHQPTEMEKNEAAARETLVEMVQAVHSYAATFPEIGYPSSLKPVTETEVEVVFVDWADQPAGEGNDRKPQGKTSRLLDRSYAADPLIKAGYRFRYLLTGTGTGEENNFGSFEIMASPVEFGKTGARNYLFDRSGIHVTTENRPATAEDPRPLD